MNNKFMTDFIESWIYERQDKIEIVMIICN